MWHLQRNLQARIRSQLFLSVFGNPCHAKIKLYRVKCQIIPNKHECKPLSPLLNTSAKPPQSFLAQNGSQGRFFTPQGPIYWYEPTPPQWTCCYRYHLCQCSCNQQWIHFSQLFCGTEAHFSNIYDVQTDGDCSQVLILESIHKRGAMDILISYHIQAEVQQDQRNHLPPLYWWLAIWATLQTSK